MHEADSPARADGTRARRAGLQLALLASVFVVAACGLVYELVAGALASYLLGDSVLQFSTVIGCYLFAMGVGSWASRHLVRGLAAHFLRIEIAVGVIGGFMPAMLFFVHAWAPGPFRIVLYGLVLAIGVLVGLEIPLVMRLLRREYALKDLVSQVLTFDYLGALAVSLAFPLLFVPQLGMIRTGLFFGLANTTIALWALWLFRAELERPRAHAATAIAAVAVLAAAFTQADAITTFAEDQHYADRVIHAESTPYQRIVLTQARGDLRLFLNGNLQFSSRDEYRYHEALVHPVLAAHPAPRRVLVLGGGDGLAAREVLRHPGVESVTLVELDARMTRLFSSLDPLRRLNGDSLRSPRVRIVNDDAFAWLDASQEMFDVAIVDLPDPTSYAIGKLYSTAFYSVLERRLAASGFAVVQTTSPLYARRSFWCVVETLEAVGLRTRPYHALVPSFGEWGFVIASRRPWPAPAALPEGLRFLTPAILATLFEFPADMSRVPAGVNRLNDPVLVHLFGEEWGRVPP